MNSTCEIDPVRHIVVIAMQGEVTDENCADIYHHIQRHNGVQPDYARLIDLRETRGPTVTSAGVRELARLPLLLPRGARRAVVVPSILGFGMVRMYDLWREEESSLRVFRDFDEASNWLGSDEA